MSFTPLWKRIFCESEKEKNKFLAGLWAEKIEIIYIIGAEMRDMNSQHQEKILVSF